MHDCFVKLQQLESTSTNQHKPTQKPSCITDNLAIRHFIMDKEKHIVFDICTNNQSTNHSNIITSFILYIPKACLAINYIALHRNSLRFSHISGYLITIQCNCVNQNITQQKEQHIKINQPLILIAQAQSFPFIPSKQASNRTSKLFAHESHDNLQKLLQQ